MSLKIYNTMTRRIEEFVPQKPPVVTMYACGITVYDEAHIGHASQAIFFDIIRNYLYYRGYKVKYVRNFTDIDDRIIARSLESGKSAGEISARFIKETSNDLKAIKVMPADVEPKVTEHIEDIITFIGELVEKGCAYDSEGDVYFSVAKFKDYGKLSNRDPGELISEDAGGKKRNPADFALWKSAKPGEPSWTSPWGEGRPGWHIECSVMARKHLGDTVDIHGGGIDLVFPHHENEIAQSESLTGKPLARFWIHNGLVMVDNRKMSKSLGNFHTIKDALKKHHREVIRHLVLSNTYGSNIDFSENAFLAARKRVYYFYNTISRIRKYISANENVAGNPTDKSRVMTDLFIEIMDNNFNTARLISMLAHETARMNDLLTDRKKTADDKIPVLKKFLEELSGIAGVIHFLDEDPDDVVRSMNARHLEEKGITEDEISKLIGERQGAKFKKNFEQADSIRNRLLEMEIRLLDFPDRTEWEISV
jgi:cysteinyl-tRNA synthetase